MNKPIYKLNKISTRISSDALPLSSILSFTPITSRKNTLKKQEISKLPMRQVTEDEKQEINKNIF